MKSGTETHKVEIFETSDFETGMFERKVFIDGKPVYSETVTPIIDRQKSTASPLKKFLDWLLGIEHPAPAPPKNVTTSMPDLFFGLFKKRS